MARAYDLTAISLVAMTFCLMGAVMKKKKVFWFITSFVDVKDTSENNEGNNLLNLSQEFYIISNKKLYLLLIQVLYKTVNLGLIFRVGGKNLIF